MPSIFHASTKSHPHRNANRRTRSRYPNHEHEVQSQPAEAPGLAGQTNQAGEPITELYRSKREHEARVRKLFDRVSALEEQVLGETALNGIAKTMLEIREAMAKERAEGEKLEREQGGNGVDDGSRRHGGDAGAQDEPKKE